MERLTSLKRNNEYGFTIIELIVTIIVIGIMAVTVVPRFLTSKGFEEYTYRDELITKLRSIQLRTMQQTDSSECQEIKVDVTNGIIGLLKTKDELAPASDPLCIAIADTYAGESTTITINDNHNVVFTISGGLSSFSFSSLGRPEATGCGNTTTLCEITVTVAGESSLAITINREGYIYAL